jgi:alkanesulfonate monooxygenase SsuD/methylene tetrahydromethanopterin reductase-like flavin-dependent oxidoreductase (luciferase family)
MDEQVAEMRRIWSQEPPFEGADPVGPPPVQPGGPPILLGSMTPAGIQRAARIADGFIPSVPEVWDFYRDEVQLLGRPAPGPSPIGKNQTVALAENPEKGWEEMAPFFLHEMNAYGVWQDPNDPAPPYRAVKDIDELRASGQYRVVTPEQFVDEQKAAPFPFAFFHPLCGGMPIDLAWSSLRLFENEVLPAFK